MEPSRSILMIDDDRDFCALIKAYLEKRFFVVNSANTGKEGLEMFSGGGKYDLILLDLLLPDIDGKDVLSALRTVSPDIPIIIFSALNEEFDRVLMLEMGADDYIPKVFSSRELLAHIQSVLRRHTRDSLRSLTETRSHLRMLRGLKLDMHKGEVFLDGAPIYLTGCEIQLLSALMEQPGRVLSREELLAQIADRPFSSCDRSIDVHISSIRRKLKDTSSIPRYIKTLRNSGYCMIP